MSGEKRTPIQILQEDMRATRRQLYSIQKQRERLQQDLKQVRKEGQKEVKALKRQFEARSEKQEKAVQNLKSELKDMAVKHNQQLNEQRTAMLGSIGESEERTDEKIENLRAWTKDRLREQKREYRAIAQQQQKEINLLKRDIENINKREDNREQRARDYIVDLEILINAAEENLPDEARYNVSKRIERIQRQVEAAKHQLVEDSPQATIATVQAAHFELMDLEDEILRQEAEFEMTYRTVADSIGGLFTSVRNNRNIKLEEAAPEQEADYWTDGQYQNLEQEIEEIRSYIKNHKPELTIEELNDYLDQLEELNEQQEKLIEESVERIISSQMRAEMGDAVINTLRDQGYRIKNDECGYAEEDQRGAYLIKMSNVAGTEVVTIISPDEETHRNILSINTYGAEVYDEKVTQSRNLDIRKALKEAGIQLGETECNETGIEELYDVENLIRQGGKKLPRKVLKAARGLSSKSNHSSSE